MRRLARRLGIEERVHFRGWLAGEELARELAEASVVAVPSVWPEPFGLGGLEAFAAGRPVVASATGGIGDWLQDGVNGLAVAPGDVGDLARALDELLGDPDRQGQMGAAGREMAARRFSAERHVAALLDAYEAARAAPGAPRGAAPRRSRPQPAEHVDAAVHLAVVHAGHDADGDPGRQAARGPRRPLRRHRADRERADARPAGPVRVRGGARPPPVRLLRAAAAAAANKLLELLVWPDESIFWLLPAMRAGRRIAPRAPAERDRRVHDALLRRARRHRAARLSGLPLVLNLDDSPTCTDMHPYFPTRLHYRLARALEDLYVSRADAVVYVSRTNLELVSRAPAARRCAKLPPRPLRRRPRADFRARPPALASDFEIAYVGAMSGWWALIGESSAGGGLGAPVRHWTRLGRYERTTLDERTSSPAVIGRAILEAIAEHPGLGGTRRARRSTATPIRRTSCRARAAERRDRETSSGARRGPARAGDRDPRAARTCCSSRCPAARRLARRAHLGEDVRVPGDRPPDPRRGAARARTGTTCSASRASGSSSPADEQRHARAVIERAGGGEVRRAAGTFDRGGLRRGALLRARAPRSSRGDRGGRPPAAGLAAPAERSGVSLHR